MTYGICLLSVVSCRKEASNTSELVTQLLFGETYEIAEETEEWFKIVVTYDNYVCWLNKKQHNPLAKYAFEKIQKSKQNAMAIWFRLSRIKIKHQYSYHHWSQFAFIKRQRYSS
ncbi:MAG: SH3 domain-containing protein [Sphingobacteriaceae bacterium]|nr:SH3 domain-containing protein [Sphingobacteriaceae bacterium]